MHTLEKGTTETLKGCLQSEAQTHSLTENSGLTTALQRQREARGAPRLPDYMSGTASPRSKQEGQEEAQAAGCPLLVFFLFDSIPSGRLRCLITLSSSHRQTLETLVGIQCLHK